ncbi:uncharacterized protein IL334_001797 [Kwoniella shivajii]|uniref:Alpha-1,3/1,6-mannosyltransferase ALG2 n=1 Tax=Kwoniella shivajii TaxID=564305 RepID=A0ABZ1CT65_9TREE|nr:hypothetical protein IL334_001797 [Kwoniella shivajii]
MAPPVKQPDKLRIGFIHPDLGIGGAERLVVDAAVSLQRRGHDVVMFTSRHDPKRCFEETRDGTLKVHVLGSSLPRSFHPKLPLTIVFSMLKSLLLTFLLIMSLHWPEPAMFFNPLAPLNSFDVFVVDQQSVCVPFLRFIGGTRVVFYCHFPDKLLSGGWEIGIDKSGQQIERKKGTEGISLLKKIYRWPIDKLEEFTTGQADIVLSNSHFTSRIYARAFPRLAKRPPRVVYPCIDIEAYQPFSKTGKGKSKLDHSVEIISTDRPTLISFNRFEAKKNAALAIRAFAQLKEDQLISVKEFDNLRLVLGGGYDKDELDNVQTLSSLQSLCDSLNLRYHTLAAPDSPVTPSNTQVLFILNFTVAQRTHLLTSPNTKALLYTPANEHFGIVPIEAMSCGLPVLAADSGGPTETIVDLSSGEEGTGLLRSPNPKDWSAALSFLLQIQDEERGRVSKAARNRVESKFSLATLGEDMEKACRDAFGFGSIHETIGDILIWGGAALIAVGAIGLATMIFILAE